MIVYKTTDRIPVKIADATFWLSPLSAGQKAEMLSLTQLRGGQETTNMVKQMYLSIKYGVKKVDGLKNPDGTDYEVSLGEDGNLSEESLNDVMSLEASDTLMVACIRLAKGIKELELEGVKVMLDKVESVKKK